MSFISVFFVAFMFCVIGFIFGFGRGVNVGKRMQMKEPRSDALWILCFLFSMLVLIGSIIATAHSGVFLANSQPVEATIIELKTETDEEGYISTYPIFEYSDSDGVTHQSSSTMWSSSNYEKGGPLAIRYTRNNPTKARVDHILEFWLLPAFLLGLAIILGGIAGWNGYARNLEQRWVDMQQSFGSET